MIDRQNVIKGLECCTTGNEYPDDYPMYMGDCEKCPMQSDERKRKGICACEAWEERTVALPYNLVVMAIELLKAQDNDAEIIRKCREGKVLKHVGDGVVVLNYDWWRKMNEKCDHIKIVPSVEDLLKAQEPRVLTLAELRALPEEPHVPLAMEERVPVGTWDGGSVVRWLDSAFVQEMYVDDGTVYTNAGTYGKLWRVWTAWPDKAMREAEPWN